MSEERLKQGVSELALPAQPASQSVLPCENLQDPVPRRFGTVSPAGAQHAPFGSRSASRSCRFRALCAVLNVNQGEFSRLASPTQRGEHTLQILSRLLGRKVCKQGSQSVHCLRRLKKLLPSPLVPGRSSTRRHDTTAKQLDAWTSRTSRTSRSFSPSQRQADKERLRLAATEIPRSRGALLHHRLCSVHAAATAKAAAASSRFACCAFSPLSLSLQRKEHAPLLPR